MVVSTVLGRSRLAAYFVPRVVGAVTGTSLHRTAHTGNHGLVVLAGNHGVVLGGIGRIEFLTLHLLHNMGRDVVAAVGYGCP